MAFSRSPIGNQEARRRLLFMQATAPSLLLMFGPLLPACQAAAGALLRRMRPTDPA
jgi:hypothetical protein